MVADSVSTSLTNALVAAEVEATVEEEEDTEEEDTVDNPVTEEEATNKVVSVDNNPLTVDKVDTEEVTLLTELELNPEVTAVTTVPVPPTEDKLEVTEDNNNNPVTLNNSKVTVDKLKVELKAVTEEDTKRIIPTFLSLPPSFLSCSLVL